jgi:hypothetical protein
LEISLARVVFPVPGGPQKIIERIFPPSTIRLTTPDFPIRWSCPTNSAKFLGRILSARGAANFEGLKSEAPSFSGFENFFATRKD